MNTSSVVTRPKLTQYLIDKGYVTEENCSEALQRQVIFGGRIGTNLLELSYINEEQLLEALSQSLHIPVADPESLKTIDPENIKQIPEDLARKYKVAPFESSKGRIHLAMIDPTNMEALDEISFITGKIIKPFVTTEMKMGFLLEKYYRITRDRRFISVPEEEKKRREEWVERKKEKTEQKKVPAEAGKTIDAPPAEDQTQAPLSGFEAAAEPALDLTTFDGASRSLAQANNRDEIANTLLTFANFRLERVILLIIKGDKIQAWKTGGRWKTPEQVEKIRFPSQEPTLFSEIAETKKPYNGPLSEIEIHKKIIGTLGAPYPKDVVAFPLAIRKKVFCILYGDNAISGDAIQELQEVRKMTLKASLCFEILILKAKILFQS